MINKETDVFDISLGENTQLTKIVVKFNKKSNRTGFLITDNSNKPQLKFNQKNL